MPHNGVGNAYVIGSDSLAARLAEHLVAFHDLPVTVIVDPGGVDATPALAGVGGVRVVAAPVLDENALQAAGIAEADAVAVLLTDDAAAVRISVMIQDLVPNARLVVRMKDRSLAPAIEALFADCTVLSDAAEAVPALVAAAHGELAPPSIVRIFDRTLEVVPRLDADPVDVLCALASTVPPTPLVLPPWPDGDIVLALARQDGARPPAWARRRPRRRIRARAGRWVRGRRSRLALFAVGLFVLCVAIMAATLGTWDLTHATYQTLLTVIGSPTDTAATGVGRLVRVLVYIAGVALLVPALSAIFLNPDDDALAKLLKAIRPSPPPHDHLVLVGLGTMGRLAVRMLPELGTPAVAIERHEHAPGVAVAQHAGIPVIIGDASDPYILEQANIAAARALLCLTGDDIVNLMMALHARQLHPGLAVAMRLFDGDFAEHLRKRFDLALSHSTSYLAVTSFAVAMLGESKITTIPFGRRLLHVILKTVEPDSGLVGRSIDTLDRDGHCRIIAHRDRHGITTWPPANRLVLEPGDQVAAVVTRAGLADLLQSRPPAN